MPISGLEAYISEIRMRRYQKETNCPEASKCSSRIEDAIEGSHTSPSSAVEGSYCKDVSSQATLKTYVSQFFKLLLSKKLEQISRCKISKNILSVINLLVILHYTFFQQITLTLNKRYDRIMV